MDYVKTLLENRKAFMERGESGSLFLGDHEVLAAFDEDGNMIAVIKAWTYISETGMMMSEFLVDGSPREDSCGDKQKAEMLYLLPCDFVPGEDNRVLESENNAFPLPLAYSAGQIVCQDHVFTISSTAGNPIICGSYHVIGTQLSSAVHSYHTRGLASNVLERYYYEFLPESHQLYLDEEQFQQEMKERKNRTKDAKKNDIHKNNIVKENFQKDTNRMYTCEQKVTLWGVTTMLYANYNENPKYREWTLEVYIDQLNAHIQWIDTHETEIEQELLNDNMVERANTWMEGLKVVDEEGQSYYELEDGGRFPCPITEKSFLDSLYIGGIHISSDSPKEAIMNLFLDTEPPFFADHSIEVFIDADIDMQEAPQTDAKYTIQVNGLAG